MKACSVVQKRAKVRSVFIADVFYLWLWFLFTTIYQVIDKIFIYYNSIKNVHLCNHQARALYLLNQIYNSFNIIPFSILTLVNRRRDSSTGRFSEKCIVLTYIARKSALKSLRTVKGIFKGDIWYITPSVVCLFVRKSLKEVMFTYSPLQLLLWQYFYPVN